MLVAMGALVACGDDDDDTVAPPTAGGVEASTGPVEGSTTVAMPRTVVINTTGSGTVQPSETSSAVANVIATDYKFTGVPSSTVTGTEFRLHNESTKEVHEMIIFRIPDNVTETIGQIMALPEDEQLALVGDDPPIGVIVALPGEEGELVEGSNVINEPGRYAVLCFIPVGADPEVIKEAMQAPPGSGEPPDFEGGPPHIMEGMYAEMVVE